MCILTDTHVHMCTWVHTCTQIHSSAYRYTHKHVCRYTNRHRHTNTLIYTHVHMYTHIHMYIWVHTHVYRYTQSCTQVHTHMCNRYTHVNTCVHRYTHRRNHQDQMLQNHALRGHRGAPRHEYSLQECNNTVEQHSVVSLLGTEWRPASGARSFSLDSLCDQPCEQDGAGSEQRKLGEDKSLPSVYSFKCFLTSNTFMA